MTILSNHQFHECVYFLSFKVNSGYHSPKTRVSYHNRREPNKSLSRVLFNEMPDLNNIEHLFIKTMSLTQANVNVASKFRFSNSNIHTNIGYSNLYNVMQLEIPFVEDKTSSLMQSVFKIALDGSNGGGYALCTSFISLAPESLRVAAMDKEAYTIQPSMLAYLMKNILIEQFGIKNLLYLAEPTRELKCLNMENLFT